MRRRILLLPLLMIFMISVSLSGQQKTAPEFKLIEFQMALLKRFPREQRPQNLNLTGLHREHEDYVRALLESGKAMIAGPLTDDGDIRGIFIFRAKSLDEARSWAEADPLVKAGLLAVEMHPWWSEDVMKKPLLPLKLSTAYLGLLVRGEKWTAERTPQTEEIQKAHLANINRLAQMKKLVVAGPFGDDGVLRGIFVFKVSSLDEAKSLAETDPAVRAGRLAIIMHPWVVPEGVLP